VPRRLFAGKAPSTDDADVDDALRRAIRGKSWREYMELTRQIAVEEAERGVIEITQKGEAVTPPSAFKGPIRLRLRRTGGESIVKVENVESPPSSKRQKLTTHM